MKSKVNGGKAPLASVFRRDVAARTSGAVTKSAGGYAIADTSTTAKVGDLYRAVTGTAGLIDKELPIIEASTNSFTVASKDAPTVGDTFFILGPVTLRTAEDGSIAATISGGATEAKQDAEAVLIGALTETAPVTDTASSGLNGRLQRIAQRITSLIALFPTALGSAAAANSLAVTQSTEDIARQGIITETAPASDTASSGQNGRLQRIAQRLTTLLAVFPATIDTNSGNKSASTLRVVLATDQPALTNKLLVTPDSVALPANQSVNISQMNATTVLMGNGPTGTGSQRVTIANDNTTIPVNEIPSSASTNALTRVASTAAETGHVLKGSAGRLYMLVGYNSKTSAQFIQVHNTTTVPADTAVPIYSFIAKAQDNFSLDLMQFGDYFATGISVCNSSTLATKTIGSADCWFNALIL